ncbi:MAG: S-layer homology domain-containing protein, partial [Peptococcaceae bacterium]|nr:S-layer homology domain-containing protein [Peptococcaceae bacterium]
MFKRGKNKSGIMLTACLFLAVLLLCTYPQPAASAAAADGGPAGEAAVQAGTAVFTDLAAGSPLWPYVRFLADRGVMRGFPDGTFRPAENLTRAQAARIMVLVKGLQPVEDGPPTYSDVPADHWACGEIEAATRAGLFRGYPDGTFRPDSIITRAEAITLLLNLSGGTLSDKPGNIADVGPGHWAYRQVATAVEAGLVDLPADNLFKPELAFRRGDMARGLSALFTLSPALRAAELTGKLVVKRGQVTVTTGAGT